MTRRSWFKMYSGGEGGWLDGTVRWELTPVQRAIWTDILALCSNSRYPDAGVVASGKNLAGEFVPFPESYLIGIIQVSVEELRQALEKFVKQERISIDSAGVIHITNWKKYQSEYARVVVYRRKNSVTEHTKSDQTRSDKTRAETRQVTPNGVTSRLNHPVAPEGQQVTVVGGAADPDKSSPWEKPAGILE
jgi:hypothetical protein